MHTIDRYYKKKAVMYTTIEMLRDQDLAQVRAKAQALLQLVEHDHDFARQIASNPVTTLQALGFVDMMRSLDAHERVEHDLFCCSDGTCMASLCPSSCNISF
jgi:hypothetical protein